MSNTIIITAGGIGARMGGIQPKQFLEINGRPILFYTLEKFLEFDPTIQIILVLPDNHIETWHRLCNKFNYQIEHEVVAGGKERFHSVKNGLSLAKGDLIGIHDAVRPFVSLNVITASYEQAQELGAAIPIISPKESIRELKNKKWLAVDRSNYALVQTPQVFKAEILRPAYEQPFQKTFTDDASVVEYSGHKIHMVEGNDENIKITTPFDLTIAAAYCKK